MERLLSAWRYVFQKENSYNLKFTLANSLERVQGSNGTLSWAEFVDKVLLENGLLMENTESKGHPRFDEPDIWVISFENLLFAYLQEK